MRADHERNPPGDELSRLRRAYLATKRDELLAPARVIADITTRLLCETETIDESIGFHADIVKIYQAGQSLLGLIDDVLSHHRIIQANSSGALEELHKGLRHELLNELNVLILCSEMWIEDAADHFLDSFLPDLELIKGAALRCVRLVDEMLQSWDVADTLELSLEDVELFRRIIWDRADGESSASGQILVADDVKTNRDYLQRNLERLGHVVHVARTGLEVLERVRELNFDLVLLDIKMPELDGIAVLSRLKADPAFRNLPVIMISALSDIEVVAQCIKLGAEDYLPKPFNSVLLRARIEACLEKRRLSVAVQLEKEKSDRLLEVILPPVIVQELRTHNRVIPRRHENVAVLFADIVGFTKFCEHNRPENVMNLLSRLVELWEDSAIKHGVEKIKTLGDAFMAATGLWEGKDNPVLDCVQCGLEMIAATQALPPWDLRVGIHVGPVVAGIMGKRKYTFDLWGDTVNTAARMESHGIPGAITLSQEAWSKIERSSYGTSQGLVPIKGKGLLEMIRFDGFHPRTKRPRNVKRSRL